MLTFLLFGLQKWHSTKFDSALRQKLISIIRELLKASFKPLPQGFGAISGGSRGTNHQYLYFMREWEGEQLDLRQFLILSTGYYLSSLHAKDKKLLCIIDLFINHYYSIIL